MPKVTGGSVAAHREAALQTIFDAFARLLDEQGYEPTTLADVAAAAGMSRTTIYNYFRDKESLAVAFAEHEVGAYLRRLRAALDAVDDPVERLRIYIRHQIGYFAANHLALGRGLQMVLPAETYQRVLHHVQVLEGMLADILDEGSRAGVFTNDTGALLPLVVACVNRGGPSNDDGFDLDDEVELTEGFVLRALGARIPDPSG